MQKNYLENKRRIPSNVFLWIAAIIWGFAFVAQRLGMETMGPFYFNVIRFLLGSIAVFIFLFINNKFKFKKILNIRIKDAVITGVILFIASTFQQIGIIYTTAGKAGFISGSYVAIVPILGLFLGQRINKQKGIGMIIVFLGLFLLTYQKGLAFVNGDIILFISAICWAFHIQFIDKFIRRNDPVAFSFAQFFVSGLLSLIPALLFEDISTSIIRQTALPLLYAGVLSVGIAYTFQVIGQKSVEPSIAALIMSFETVFALLGGWLILSEKITLLQIIACFIMFIGIILVQINIKMFEKIFYKKKEK